MIEMLHNEARKLMIEALEKKHKVQEVADCYSVNRSTVYRLKNRWEETGSFETRTFLRGRKPALSPETLASIDQLVKDKPDITLQEIVDTLHLTVSIETVRKALLKCGRRKRFMPANRSVPDVAEKRKARNGIISGFSANNLVFLDESGCNIDMTRRYAYAQGGSRAVDSAPLSKPKNTTIMSSIQLDGSLHYTTFSGGTTVRNSNSTWRMTCCRI